MQASFDLFAEPAPVPTAAPLSARSATPPAPVSGPATAPRPAGRTLHPTVASVEGRFQDASKSRAELRAELQAANVATVRFDVQAGELIRISQFQPAGNQCIGLYPGPLVSIGRAMLPELQSDSGLIEWEVASDQPRCVSAPAAEGASDDDAERPRP